MADNDNHQDEGSAAPSSPGASSAGSGIRVIVQLASARTDKDGDNIEALLAEAYDLSAETLKWIKLEDYDSDLREILVKQGTALVGAFTKLLAAKERHRKSLQERS